MSARRILVPFVGDTVGGSHISALHLVRGLPRDRYDPVIGLHQPTGLLADYLAENAMPWIPLPDVALPSMASLRRQIPVFARATGPLRKVLRDERIDIVHTQDIRMHQLWGLPARLGGAAHLWHQRTPTRNKRLGTYARTATRAVAVSDYCRSQLAPRLRDKAEVVTNPFTLPELPDRAVAREKLLAEIGRPDAQAVIGFVSHFTERKRPLLFVELAGALRDRGYTNCVFPMFGEARPPMGPEVLAAIEARGLTGTVFPMGLKFPIEPWLAGCDLFIAPSVNEAFGRALVEAMFCATPCIAADHGGNPEIYRNDETGVLVPPDDLDAFTDAAAGLLDHPDRARRLAEAARAEAVERFSVEAHVAAMERVYAKC
ncbi:glycosyltransferase involved in cell wall biosynthesis [Aliiruegeria haliotis]|uniref:Glycosyltransferase involved in cell wall biosynthesis n=1 Tax=Aliiruegeria haliotis TaxID=1280846 RepID=A0A2T0RNK1_9RHOB|nr:glycosyltransferase family 4 protein [Aliiruegeria haliotis]PRY22700.1 glycosyltransferase involved in cell wall biosynthesis [Aliiruegeria haliotis]